MPRAPSSGTKPERDLDQILRHLGYNDFVSNYPIKLSCRVWPIVPDKVFLTRKVAMYCHGEYWHRPSAKKSRKRQMQKDESHVECLKNNGWKVLEFMGADLALAVDYLNKKAFRDKGRAKRAKKSYERIISEVKDVLK